LIFPVLPVLAQSRPPRTDPRTQLSEPYGRLPRGGVSGFDPTHIKVYGRSLAGLDACCKLVLVMHCSRRIAVDASRIRSVVRIRTRATVLAPLPVRGVLQIQ